MKGLAFSAAAALEFFGAQEALAVSITSIGVGLFSSTTIVGPVVLVPIGGLFAGMGAKGIVQMDTYGREAYANFTQC
jgi:hypothetical protein